MVRPDVAARKIALAAARLDDAEDLLSQPLADARSNDLTAFYLMLAIQECIDLAAHWISEAGWPPPDDAAAAFDVLAKRGAIPGELVLAMQAATGLRNRIAHGYATVDHQRLRREAGEGMPALRQFLKAVADTMNYSPQA